MNWRRWKDIRYWPRQFKGGVKNLWTWFPIIWKDCQWDHSFFLQMLEKKLTLMENYFETGTIIKDTKEVAHTMRKARISIQRLRKDEYEDYPFDKLHKKWGEPQFDWIPTKVKHMDGYELNIKHKHINTPEDEKKYSKEMRRIREHTNTLRQQDKELFCKMFQKYLETWWE